MFRLFKQVFILFLSFSSSLAREPTKFLSLNEKQCIVRPALIDLNPLEKHVNVNVKIIVTAKKIIVGILAHAFVRIASILKVLLILQ